MTLSSNIGQAKRCYWRIDYRDFSTTKKQRSHWFRHQSRLCAILNGEINIVPSSQNLAENCIKTFNHTGLIEMISLLRMVYCSKVTIQPKIMEKIHYGHQGSNKCKIRAKTCVFWSGINSDIDKIIQQCATCQEHQKSQTAESLTWDPNMTLANRGYWYFQP